MAVRDVFQAVLVLSVFRAFINETSRSCAGSRWPRRVRSASWKQSLQPQRPRMRAVSTISPVLLHLPLSELRLSAVLSITQPIRSRMAQRPLS